MKKFAGCVIKENTITLTKAFAKQAYTPGTAEFRYLAELHKAFPEFSIEMRTATPKEDKKKHNGLTVARMEFLIKNYLGDEIALAEFTEVQKFYKGTKGYYGKVKGWFLNWLCVSQSRDDPHLRHKQQARHRPQTDPLRDHVRCVRTGRRGCLYHQSNT